MMIIYQSYYWVMLKKWAIFNKNSVNMYVHTHIKLKKYFELYTHNIVLWKRKLKMAIDIVKFVDIIYNKKENI